MQRERGLFLPNSAEVLSKLSNRVLWNAAGHYWRLCSNIWNFKTLIFFFFFLTFVYCSNSLKIKWQNLNRRLAAKTHARLGKSVWGTIQHTRELRVQPGRTLYYLLFWFPSSAKLLFEKASLCSSTFVTLYLRILSTLAPAFDFSKMTSSLATETKRTQGTR